MFAIIEKTEHRSGSPGNYSSHEVNDPLESTLEAMSATLALGDKIVRIRERATQNRVL